MVIEMKNEITRKSRTSPMRKFISYMILGIFTFIPLGIYYLLNYYGLLEYEMIIFEFYIGNLLIEVSFAQHMIPLVASVMIGVCGSFILWCYYTRTRCLEEQMPNSTLLSSD